MEVNWQNGSKVSVGCVSGSICQNFKVRKFSIDSKISHTHLLFNFFFMAEWWSCKLLIPAPGGRGKQVSVSWGHLNLQSKFEHHQSYIEKFYLKKKRIKKIRVIWNIRDNFQVCHWMESILEEKGLQFFNTNLLKIMWQTLDLISTVDSVMEAPSHC